MRKLLLDTYELAHPEDRGRINWQLQYAGTLSPFNREIDLRILSDWKDIWLKFIVDCLDSSKDRNVNLRVEYGGYSGDSNDYYKVIVTFYVEIESVEKCK